MKLKLIEIMAVKIEENNHEFEVLKGIPIK